MIHVCVGETVNHIKRSVKLFGSLITSQSVYLIVGEDYWFTYFQDQKSLCPFRAWLSKLFTTTQDNMNQCPIMSKKVWSFWSLNPPYLSSTQTIVFSGSEKLPLTLFKNPDSSSPLYGTWTELLPRNFSLRNAFTVDWSEIEVKGAVDARTGEHKRMVVWERVRERWVSIDRLTENKREDGRDAVRTDRVVDRPWRRRWEKTSWVSFSEWWRRRSNQRKNRQKEKRKEKK